MTPTLNIHHCREQHNIKMGLCNCREENLDNPSHQSLIKCYNRQGYIGLWIIYWPARRLLLRWKQSFFIFLLDELFILGLIRNIIHGEVLYFFHKILENPSWWLWTQAVVSEYSRVYRVNEYFSQSGVRWVITTLFCSSEEWKKVSKSEREKLGVTVQDDGEFWWGSRYSYLLDQSRIIVSYQMGSKSLRPIVKMLLFCIYCASASACIYFSL